MPLGQATKRPSYAYCGGIQRIEDFRNFATYLGLFLCNLHFFKKEVK